MSLDAPGLPVELQVEVTAACNLRCHMCLVRYRPPVNRVEGSMDLATFRRLVDELPGLEKLTLQGLGEPLLAPDLFAMVEYAASRGVRVGFNTNATLLTEEKAERLVRAGLSWLHVSLDGAEAATYESVRDGARFERVARNVAGLNAVKRRLGAEHPSVRLVFVAMRRNLAELPAVVRLAAAWGVDDVRVQNLSHSFEDTAGDPGYEAIRRFTEDEALWAGDDAWARSVYDDARRAAAQAGVALRLPESEGPPPPRTAGEPGCGWPFGAGYVTHDGKAQPCCMVMGEDRAVLGDVREHGFATVWRGSAYRSFRRALETDEPPEVCRGCSMYRRVF